MSQEEDLLGFMMSSETHPHWSHDDINALPQEVSEGGLSEKSSRSTKEVQNLVEAESETSSLPIATHVSGLDAFHVLQSNDLPVGREQGDGADSQSEKPSLSAKVNHAMQEQPSESLFQPELEQEMQDVCGDVVANISRQTSELREEISELSWLSELHTFGVFQEALAGQQSNMVANFAQLAKIVGSLAAGMGIEPSSATAVATHATQSSMHDTVTQIGSVAISTPQTGTLGESEALQSITARCQSALKSVQDLHQQVLRQCHKLATKMSKESAELPKDVQKQLVTCLGTQEVSQLQTIPEVPDIETPLCPDSDVPQDCQRDEKLLQFLDSGVLDLNQKELQTTPESLKPGQWIAVQEQLRTVKEQSEASQWRVFDCLQVHEQLAQQVSDLSREVKQHIEVPPRQWSELQDQMRALSTLSTKSIGFLEDCQGQVDICLSAQERIATQVSDLAKEVKRQGEVSNQERWCAVQEQLDESFDRQQRFQNMLEALTMSGCPHVAAV